MNSLWLTLLIIMCGFYFSSLIQIKRLKLENELQRKHIIRLYGHLKEIK